MAATGPVAYLQERTDGFSYPRFARQRGIETTPEFWSFWTLYYGSGAADREALKRLPKYPAYIQLWSRIFSEAAAAAKLRDLVTSTPGADKKNQ